MHISKLQLVNYRNFARADVHFKRGINTIIGENASGKTNLFRAIRLLLDDTMLRSARHLEETDFHRGLGGAWRGHWIIISLEFEDVSQDEAIQSLFLHGAGNIDGEAIGKATYNLIFRPKAAIRAKLGELEDGDHARVSEILGSVSLDDYETIFTGKSTANFADPAVYEALVGSFVEARFPEELEPPEIGGRIPGIMSITKEVSFTFVQALRDVVADFQNNRTNPLLTLLRGKSGEISTTTMEPITELVRTLNTAIVALPEVDSIRSDIRETITDAAGETYSPSTLAIRSALPDDADRLFQSLRLFVGESDDGYEGAIHELSLGGANLIYLTLKLLEFKYQTAKHAFANFLLIEEPEAHIHTHIQKTLFDRLNYPETQVIYSTHSTHISEVSNVRNVNILGRVDGRCEVFQPAAGLLDGEVRSIQRYLDAVRSNLLFAKSVVLVEGDAEEILVPALVKKVLGVSLDELGISLINIRSTGFKNVAVLFNDARIRKRCAIVTDLDTAFIDTTPNLQDAEATVRAKEKALNSQVAGLQRQVELHSFVTGNPWLSLHFAARTFEVEFVAAGNTAEVVGVLGEVYKDGPTIALAKEEIESGAVHRYGTRVLTMANHVGKGWFAIQVAKSITPNTHVPGYIIQAIFAAHGIVSPEIYANIFDYRLRCIATNPDHDVDALAKMRDQLRAFRAGTINGSELHLEMLAAFPADEINAILAHLK
jgi:putative ATP-dependent endonuclease of OLD family